MSGVAVIGAGYVGLVTSACLAQLGHNVRCLEVDEQRLTALRRGKTPIHEPGLDELVAAQTAAGRLTFTDDYSEALADAEFAFVAVPTPPMEDGLADTSHVFSAALSVISNARPGLVILVKSTVPVGTGDEISRQLGTGFSPIHVVSNPEFLREGTAVLDFLQPDRIVVGADSPDVSAAVAELYSEIEAPIVCTTRRSAELAKYTANAFLAARISLMNEIASVCEAVDADVDEVARIVGMDRRIGPEFLKAGLGWGGSCFPKDVLALTSLAAELGSSTPILQAVCQVNARQRHVAVERLLEAVRLMPDPAIAVLGLAFKPHTDDVRGAPGLEIALMLATERMHVRAHDPVASENARRVAPHLVYSETAYEAIKGADAVLLATDWPDYAALDWQAAREMMRGNTVVDGRNFLDGAALAGLGFHYSCYGRDTASLNGRHQSLNGERLVEVETIAHDPATPPGLVA